MFDYTVATPAEYEKCLDFGNYVFSQAHCPHDFRALLPKTYGNTENFSKVPHYIAKRGEDIRAMIACRYTPLKFLDIQLECGFVGTVSSHPYARGEGHMKRLMADMIADGRKRGYDMLVLGGQRQRYGYFGFERGGAAIRFGVSARNLRHTCKDLDLSGISFREMDASDAERAYELYNQLPVRGVRDKEMFLTTLYSWTQKAYTVLYNGEFAGYIIQNGSEIVLADEEMFVKVIAAFFAAFKLDEMRFSCGIHQKRRIEQLRAIAESWSVETVEMINVLNWVNVLNAMFKYKVAYMPLPDGEKTLVIEDTPLTIRVKDGKAEVVPADNADGALKLDHMEAMRLFFYNTDFLMPNDILPAMWAPLPFFMTSVDGF